VAAKAEDQRPPGTAERLLGVREQVVLWNFFDGNGAWVGEERVDDPELSELA
jgi:hypothetical protein